ncbi:MAG TPA: S1 family peptidase [Streptosporangiaceae bacterium]|nr:S1 family peptidase [Streptosporangiaceae bacterium]
MTLVTRRSCRWWYGSAAVAVAASALLAAGSGTANAAIRTAPAPPTAAALQAARAALAGRLVPDTAVGIDPLTHHVVLTIGSKATRTAGLLSAARSLGPTVQVERFPGAITPAAGHILDGDGIVTATGVGCTLGFNVTGGFALTAGHCAVNGGPWYKAATGALFGPAVDAQIPGSDFGLLKDKGGLAQPGAIQAYDGTRIPVIGAAEPYLGEWACKSGATTGITCGAITVLNVTVMYPDGSIIYNQIQSTVCLQPGDSGGPLYDDSGNIGATALGLAASFIGDCSAGTFFYQPVVPALNFYGVQVLTSG